MVASIPRSLHEGEHAYMNTTQRPCRQATHLSRLHRIKIQGCYVRVSKYAYSNATKIKKINVQQNRVKQVSRLYHMMLVHTLHHSPASKR